MNHPSDKEFTLLLGIVHLLSIVLLLDIILLQSIVLLLDIIHHHYQLKRKKSSVLSIHYINRSIPNRVYFQPIRGIAELKRDYPHLYICKDFMKVVSCWKENEDNEIPLFGTIKMNTEHLAVEKSIPTEISYHIQPVPCKEKIRSLLATAASQEIKYSVNVKLALFSGFDLMNLSKLKSGEDTLNHLIRFLVLKTASKDHIFLPGGNFGKFNKLDDITDDLLIGRMIDYARTQLNIDLSPCQHWLRMVEIWYKRNETSRGEKCDYQEVTIVFIPDLWNGISEIPTLRRALKEGEELPKENVEKAEENKKMDEKPIEIIESENKTNTIQEKEDNSEKESVKKEETNEYSREQLKALRVTDLRAILKKKGLPVSVRIHQFIMNP